MAALYGESEAVRELLNYVPSQSRSELPATINYSLVKVYVQHYVHLSQPNDYDYILQELGTEADLTPLHLASYAGSDDAVRALLNSPGTSVDSATSPAGYTSLHLACLGGHVGVVGLLLSRSTTLLHVS